MFTYVKAATTLAAPSHVLSPVTAEIERGMAGKSS